MILNKWGIALLQFVIFILTTYTLFNADALVTTVEWWQFGGLAVAQVGVVIVPLTTGGYAAILKVSVAAGGALFSAVVLIIDTANGGLGWAGSSSVIVVALAVANAVAVHFGVQIRLDGLKDVFADPNQSNAAAAVVDPGATKALTGTTAPPPQGATFNAYG